MNMFIRNFIDSMRRRKKDKEASAILDGAQTNELSTINQTQAVTLAPPIERSIEPIEVTGNNIKDCIGLSIVAFKWAVPGACGEGAGIVFITSDGKLYHANYLYGDEHISIDDTYLIFPPLKSMKTGQYGDGGFAPEWREHYLGLGNSLVVHESISEKFTKTAENELARLKKEDDGIILYDIWASVVLKILN